MIASPTLAPLLPEVSVVIPTFNESGNITELLARLSQTLPAGLSSEVIFVDDSVDDTPQVIEAAARECPIPVRMLHREEPGGGLGGAVVEGLKLATAPWVVVMDADLQHPPEAVADLVRAGDHSGADLVVATRYAEGGRSDGLKNFYRVLVSRLSTLVTKAIFPRSLRGISDPMSGFFAVRKSAVRSDVLRPLGYKILIELAVRCQFGRRTEVPYAFGERFAGDSKSSAAEGLRFLRHMALLRLGSPWPPRLAFTAGGLAIAAVRPGPWLALAILLLGVGFARAAGWHGHRLRLIVLALGVFVTAIDYLSWRLSVLAWTLPGVLIGLPLLLAELHAAFHTVGLHVTLWPVGTRRFPLAIARRRNAPPLYVFVPTVDEGTAIVGETLRGILAARDRYLMARPDRRITIVVCNDGGVAGAACSDAVIDLCGALGVDCVTRTVGGGAKAGNIEHARQLFGATGDALIAIFDADQIPGPDFFVRTLRPFDDPAVGWVQSGQFYGNRDTPVARWADDQQSLFYRLLCPGKAAHDSAFICGTNVVLRAAALDEIGGLPTDSVTEDFAASIQLAPRWRSVYLPGVLAVGLGPADLPAYLKQQERWARGTLSVLRGRWRELVLPARFSAHGGLRAGQRLQYGLAVTHYLSGVRDLIFVVAPVLFLLTGLSGVRGATLADFFAHFLPYYLLAMVAFLHAARGTTSWRAIVIGYGSFPSLVKAAWMTLAGVAGRFTITPKKRTANSPWRSSWPHLGVLAACLLALVTGVLWHRSPMYWLADFWLVYLCALTSAHLWLVHLDARAARTAAEAESPRVPRPDPGPLALRHHQRKLVPVLLGLALTMACSASSNPVLAAESKDGPPGFVPGTTAVGVSGTSDTHVSRLRGEMGVGFGLQGRTMEIGDTFDADWAAQVVDNGATPWLTLVLGKDGRPDLRSGLTAIANGADDAVLRRWATAVAAFGRPIYLTMLPQVDRNYPTTSAVTRGGIPQDVPRAWSRLRRVFAAAGARNVAWVWNPGDPSHDAAYSPPEGQIDAVAITLFEYPGTRWVVPSDTLRQASLRHPGKRLLLQVAVAGPGRDRARWMLSVGAAARMRSDVAGLVYHDSGPVHSVDDPAALPWSMSADLTFQQTVRRVFDSLAGPSS